MIASILYFALITTFKVNTLFPMPNYVPKIMRKPHKYIVQPNSL